MDVSERRRTGVGILLMVGSALAWASGTLLSKVALDRSSLAPSSLLAAQLGASVVLLALVTAARGELPRDVATWRHGATGLLEPGLAYQLGIAGLAITSASHASLIGSIEPMLVPLLAWAVWRRRPSRARLALLLVVAAGTLMLVSGESGDNSSATGDLLVLAATVSAALYVIASASSVATVDPLPLALTQQVVALVPTAAIAIVVAPQLGTDSPGILALVGLSGVVNYAIPFTLYLAALQRLDAAAAAQYLTLIPVFGFAGAILWLGESISPTQAAGTGLVITALLLLSRTRSSRKDAGAHPADDEYVAAPTSGPAVRSVQRLTIGE